MEIIVNIKNIQVYKMGTSQTGSKKKRRKISEGWDKKVRLE
jgi:hypothetical protein